MSIISNEYYLIQRQGFAHSRRATFTVESATFNTEVMAIQNGTEIATGSQEITYYDTITVGRYHYNHFYCPWNRWF